jgi:hypothetical protein
MEGGFEAMRGLTPLFAIGHTWDVPGSISGVIGGEDIARLLPRQRVDAIRRDLVGWDINLFESVRDAEGT